MKVRYKTILNASYPETQYVIIGPTEYCCKDLQDCGAICEGAHERYRGSYKLNIGDYKYESYDDYPIDFCPFCGQKINYVEEIRVKIIREKFIVTENKEKIVEHEVLIPLGDSISSTRLL